MATPDAEDASPSPDYSGDQDGSEMADSKEQRASSDASPLQANSNSSATKPASNAKDPLRPRRKKARRACFACQRAHLTCGTFSIGSWGTITFSQTPLPSCTYCEFDS